MNKSKGILVISTMPFPSGNASVNRIISYAKGLSELGEKVDVVTSSGGDCKWQELDGFRFRSLTKEAKGKFGKLLSLLVAQLSLTKLLLSQGKRYKAVLLISNSLMIIYPLFMITRLIGVKLVQEKSEFPFVLRKKNLAGKIYARYYIETTYRLFDGLIIMTNPLMEYFKTKVRKECKLFLMPMTVDVSRFDKVVRNSNDNYIAYCGDIGGNKDGVENLISSFNMIKQKYSNWKLMIIGGTSANEERKIRDFANKLDIPNLIFFGRALRENMPQLLVNAKILVLARPSSLQSSGGFPTKLGEYLSTSNPVIVTKVGEIPHYLSDNENAFLVEPDDIKAFAAKMSHVIDNYDRAKIVGVQGRELAMTIFNYQYQSSRLQNYINTEL